MTRDDLYARFCQCENESNATDIVVDGIKIWEAIRTDVYRRVRINRGDWDELGATDSNTSIATYANLMSLAGRNIFIKNPLFSPESDILCLGYYTRRKESDGVWWDIYCDPLLSELDSYDALYLETHDGGKHHTPAKTNNIRYTDSLDIFAKFKKKIGWTNYRLSSDEVERLELVEENLRSLLDVDVDLQDIARKRAVTRRTKKPLYTRLIRRIDPEAVLIVVRHGKESFIEAAKELGVPVVELQHGILTDYEYSYPADVSSQLLPDYFFTWGPFWERHVELPIPDDNIVPVGYPYLENKAAEYKDLPVRDQVLFISQPNIGTELANIAVEVSKTIESSTQLLYKLHPKEQNDWQSTYPQLSTEAVQVIGADGPSLYKLLSQSHSQVGVFSTALYEGLMFDLRTYIVNLPGAANLAEMYCGGPAELVSDARHLSNALDNPQQRDFDQECYFKSDSIQNIRSQLQQIIENGS